MKRSKIYFKRIFFCFLMIGLTFYSKVYTETPTTSNINVSSSIVAVNTTVASLNVVNPSTISYFNPRTSRNPFLSPVDYEKIRIMEEEKKKQKELREKEEKQAQQSKKEKENPFKKIKVEGIVGNYVIINGISVREGKTYKKDYLIERVGENYVIINYKGRKQKFIIK